MARGSYRMAAQVLKERAWDLGQAVQKAKKSETPDEAVVFEARLEECRKLLDRVEEKARVAA